MLKKESGTSGGAEKKKSGDNSAKSGCLGKIGENIASRFLQSKGYAILGRNWRYGRLELDIVCEDGDTLVFVEVKTRSGKNFGGPAGAITKTKQRHMFQAAQGWLLEHEAWRRPCRFDIVCLVKSGNTFGVEHYRNAFDLTQIMDCVHSHREFW